MTSVLGYSQWGFLVLAHQARDWGFLYCTTLWLLFGDRCISCNDRCNSCGVEQFPSPRGEMILEFTKAYRHEQTNVCYCFHPLAGKGFQKSKVYNLCQIRLPERFFAGYIWTGK
ncbi:MAG: hypothetical protein AB4372_09850 [Xenococcus sp. (in: cyanobacteria)]